MAESLPPPSAHGSLARPRVPRARPGRRPGDSDTRGDILRAARKVFAQRGYTGATMRHIAREADVNSALIHHFFETKEGVFRAVIQDVYSATGILERTVLPGPARHLGGRVLRGYLELWSDPATRDPMLAIVRSAVSNDEAAALAADLVGDNVVRPVVRAIGATHPELRATLAVTQLVGLAVVRYVIRIEPLASLEEAALVDMCAPSMQRYLTGEIRPEEHARRATPGGRPPGECAAGVVQGLFLEPRF